MNYSCGGYSISFITLFNQNWTIIILITCINKTTIISCFLEIQKQIESKSFFFLNISNAHTFGIQSCVSSSLEKCSSSSSSCSIVGERRCCDRFDKSKASGSCLIRIIFRFILGVWMNNNSRDEYICEWRNERRNDRSSFSNVQFIFFCFSIWERNCSIGWIEDDN